MLNTSTQGELLEQEDTLEPFVIQVPTVPLTMLGREVKEIFLGQPEAEGVVVMDGSLPQGIIMRTNFFQKLGSLYGNSLFLERPIKILIDTEVLTVSIDDTAANIGIAAMKRTSSKLHDYIIVCDQQQYKGVISIRQFLIGLSKRNEAQIQVLQTQQRKLIQAHKQEVDLRNNLIYKSHTVKNLLDHAGQGFMMFGRDFIIKDEFSTECTKIFKRAVGGESYISLATEYFGEDKLPVFTAAFSGYFANVLQVTDHVYLSLLPAEGVIEGKSIHFEYKRVENSGEKSVMVILNDITERKAMERAMQEEQNTQRLVIKALTYQLQIKQMLAEFYELFRGGYKAVFDGNSAFGDALNELYRAVHTFKGDFAQYGFVHSSEQLHFFEDKLGGMLNDRTADYNRVLALMEGVDADAVVRHDIHTITSVLGTGYFEKDEALTVPHERFTALEQVVIQGPETLGRNEVLDLLGSLKKRNIKLSLEQYADYLQYLAQSLMKNCPVFMVEGDDIYINAQTYNALLRSLVHIFRNAMDHRIESDEERLACGKPEQGVILCRVLQNDGGLSLEISDDGRGINVEALRQKAVLYGLIDVEQLMQMSAQECINFIFLDRFSTKETADSLSGRGVGMAAVLSACEGLGGKIAVASQPGNGTTFTLTLPNVIADS